MNKSNKSNKCRYNSVMDSDSDENDEDKSITIADGTKDDLNLGLDDEEMKIKLWSRMRPPRIGGVIPAIKIDRLEKTRLLLNSACEMNDNLKEKVESLIELQKDSRGNITKTVSKKTVSVYPPDSHIQKKVCVKPDPVEIASKTLVAPPPVIPATPKKCCKQ